VSEPDPDLLNRAAACYQRAGALAEAARCYREAGSYRRAADLHERLGRHRDAALDQARAGNRDLAAWLLVQYAGDPAAARDHLAALPTIGPAPAVPAMHQQLAASPTISPGTAPAVPALRRQLVLARCDVAQGRAPRTALDALAQVCTELARPATLPDQYLEPWSVALAEAIGRPDQVALVFAAAVRGRRPGAEERWRVWMRDVLHADLILPAPESPPPAAARPGRAGVT
jgi:hypothetical protein